MAATAPVLRIGRLARAGGVSVETIRYYERRGLLPGARRESSGYRIFADDAAARLRFIRRAQELGFSLDEIASLLALSPRSRVACREVQAHVRQRLAEIDRRLERLRGVQQGLLELLDACERRGGARDCPLLASLGEEGHDGVDD